jgi:2-keto-3-deoxy-L-rhamnonate aldolase RhmA
MLVDTVEEAQRWIAAGVKFIAYSSDVAILHKGYAQVIHDLRSRLG